MWVRRTNRRFTLVAHPIRIRIRFRPATAEETAKALGITRAEKKVAEALVKRLLEGKGKARRKRPRAAGASAKSA